MTWFEKLTGFPETNAEAVYNNIYIDGKQLISSINNNSMQHGSLSVSSLATLREATQTIKTDGNKTSFKEITGDVGVLHADITNAGALFQAASQFNLLEMVSPSVTPEMGVSGYEHDHTQGPACAIACGAGTIYRNYFAQVGNQQGQVHGQQIDCLDLLAQYFDNEQYGLWKMRNGYAFPTAEGLSRIEAKIATLNDTEYQQLLGLLRIGIQWDTEVTTSPNRHLVSQAYCSALPVLYTSIPAQQWEAFARLVLNATYEATFHAALLNRQKTGSNKLFLTLVGGGVFGNKSEWIIDAMLRSLILFQDYGLEVKVVSYGQKSPVVEELTQKMQDAHL